MEIPLPSPSDFIKRTLSYVLFKSDIDETDFVQKVKDHALYGINLPSDYETILDKKGVKPMSLDKAEWRYFEIGKLFKVEKGSD